MDKTQQRIIEIIDQNRDKIISLAKSIKGERGYYEFDTADKTIAALYTLGLPLKSGLARTGIKAEKQFSQGKKLAIISELDGITCPSHPLANPENGVAHACGHSAQLAAMYGAAIALCDEAVAKTLSGSAVFFAVPNEEYTAHTKQLAQDGITQAAGKPELIKRGEFNDISAALITHIHMLNVPQSVSLGFNACCGFTSKTITIKGVAAHAAIAPHCGVNALSAASLALNAIGLLRETFKESDCIRIHSNIEKGGAVLNVVPDEIVVKALVRGKNKEAIDIAAKKLDTAFTHCALALGATAEIQTENGYIPTPYLPVHDVLVQAVNAIGVEYTTASIETNFGSTDVGFLTEIMPVLGFTHGGSTGSLHSADFAIINDEDAYIIPAKMFALQAYGLLKDNAAGLTALCADYNAREV